MAKTTPLNKIERGQLCHRAILCYHGVTGSLSSLPGLIKCIIRERAWECRRTHGQTIKLVSLRELIVKDPPSGWREDPEKIEAVIHDDPEAITMYRKEMYGKLGEHRRPSKEEQTNKPDAIRFIGNIAGDSCSYWQARFQRDCPEEIPKLASGEKTIMDIRREHGWVSKSKRVTLTGDPKTDRPRLIEAWDEDYVRALVN